eukprot:4241186-Prymnesium_polylepis.2
MLSNCRRFRIVPAISGLDALGADALPLVRSVVVHDAHIWNLGRVLVPKGRLQPRTDLLLAAFVAVVSEGLEDATRRQPLCAIRDQFEVLVKPLLAGHAVFLPVDRSHVECTGMRVDAVSLVHVVEVPEDVKQRKLVYLRPYIRSTRSPILGYTSPRPPPADEPPPRRPGPARRKSECARPPP